MRAIRITQSNWLNDQVGGDVNTVKLVQDDMARDAVEVHKIAVYAPEYDQQATAFPPRASTTQAVLDAADVTFVGPDKAAERMQQLVEATEEPDLHEQPYIAEDDLDRLEAVADGTGQPQVALEMPSASGSRAQWAKWARYADPTLSPAKASALTKGQLMSRYGERL